MPFDETLYLYRVDNLSPKQIIGLERRGWRWHTVHYMAGCCDNEQCRKNTPHTESVLFHPNHWAPVNQDSEIDFRHGRAGFKALTKLAKAHAEDVAKL